MLHHTSGNRAACADQPALFQHELLEDPSAARGDGERRRQLTLLTERARTTCDGCPLFNSCLYDAVVNHDVAGFAAGTTQAQRTQLRARLGVSVEKENFDALTGAVRGGRQLNHEEVLRLRQANPDQSLEVLAMRLGCSLSTVKRHMRRARAAAASESPLAVVKPTMARVLAAFAALVRPHHRDRQVA